MYQAYQDRPETRRTGSVSLAIPMLFLISPDKLDIKRKFKDSSVKDYSANSADPEGAAYSESPNLIYLVCYSINLTLGV